MVCLGSVACSSAVDIAGERQKVGAENGTGSTPSGDGGAEVCGNTCQRVELRATGDGSQNPLVVPPGDEEELCSSFHLDSAAGSHATFATPLVDNGSLLHDMSLFKMSTPQTNGFAEICPTNEQNAKNFGLPPDGGTLEWSWPTNLGDTPVSFEIPPGDFILATRYLNVQDHPQSDNSGVSLCVCPN